MEKGIVNTAVGCPWVGPAAATQTFTTLVRNRTVKGLSWLLEAGDDPVMEPGRGRGLELLGWARPPEAEWRLVGRAQNGAGLDISPLRP